MLSFACYRTYWTFNIAYSLLYKYLFYLWYFRTFYKKFIINEGRFTFVTKYWKLSMETEIGKVITCLRPKIPYGRTLTWCVLYIIFTSCDFLITRHSKLSKHFIMQSFNLKISYQFCSMFILSISIILQFIEQIVYSSLFFNDNVTWIKIRFITTIYGYTVIFNR